MVSRNHQLIRFHLREIRIHGKVERHVRRDRVFSGQSWIEFDGVVDELAGIEQSGADLRGAERPFALAGLRQSQAGNQFQGALS